MPFTINRTVAVALATIAFLTFNSARSVVVGASASDNSETPGVVQSDDGSDGQECKNIKELETLFRGKETGLLFYKGRDYEGVNQLVERAIQECEKNPKAAKELVDFTAENLYLNRLTRFLCLQYAIENARKNESSVFRRDDVFEKLSPSINYFKRFEEAYKAEGVEGVDKALDQFALDVQKDPKLLVDYEYLDEKMTGTEDDVILRFNSQKLGDKFKKIVAAAVLRELQKNRELVPMPANDFFKLFVGAIPRMKDAEFTDDVESIWFAVAFEDDGKRDDGYRWQAYELEWVLSEISEEKADAFTERVLSLLNYDRSKESFKREDSGVAAKLVFDRFQRKIHAAIKSEDSEKIEALVDNLIEQEKEFDAGAVAGNFTFVLRDLEVARPDLARRAYEEAARLCLEQGTPDFQVFYMDCAAFYCESINAIVAADLPELERLADRVAEKAYVHATVNYPNAKKNAGEAFLMQQYQTYAWEFELHFEGRAVEVLDRAIEALEKSDKSNAKAFRRLLATVRGNERLQNRAKWR